MISLSRKNFEFIVVAFLICITHLFVYLATGFRRSSDSTYYQNAADSFIENGHSFSSLFESVAHSAHYAATIFLLALFGDPGFFYFEIVLSMISMFVFYCLLVRLLPGENHWPVRLLTFIFYISNIEILRWNYYLLSDALLINGLILIIAALFYQSRWSVALLFLLELFFGFARPTAFILLGMVAVYCLFRRPQTRGKALVSVLIVIGVLGTQLYFGNSSKAKGHYLRPFVQGLVTGHLIADPSFNFKIESPFSIQAQEVTGEEDVLELFLRYPKYTFRYLICKMGAFVFPVYPYFSVKHIFFNGFYYFLLYGFLIFGVLFWFTGASRESRLFAGFCWITFAVYVVFHSLTILDSEGRYLSPWVSLLVLSVAAIAPKKTTSITGEKSA